MHYNFFQSIEVPIMIYNKKSGLLRAIRFEKVC